jgi:hypothetical protein
MLYNIMIVLCLGLESYPELFEYGTDILFLQCLLFTAECSISFSVYNNSTFHNMDMFIYWRKQD